MQINKVAFIGKGGVGLLYGSMIAKALGNDAVEYVMDDARFERHAGDALTVNGKPCDLTSVRASEATPADLVILTVKTTGLDQALKTMERVVGPNTLIASLCNGITSEQKIAERFGWKHTVLGICQGMDAVFLNGALTFTNAGEIRFGAAAGTDPATVAAIDELYTRCGIAHTVESNIAHRMWAKLMLNDGINQTCMAYGGTYGSATEPGSEQRRCFVSAMRETLAVANAEGVELTEADLTDGSIGILTLMVKAGLAASNGEARRLVVQGGVLVDGEKVAAPTVGFTAEQLAKGIVIKKGKKIYHKVTL